MQLHYEKCANTTAEQNLQRAVDDYFEAENDTEIYAENQYEVGYATQCHCMTKTCLSRCKNRK
jgi:hypothetical protein